MRDLSKRIQDKAEQLVTTRTVTSAVTTERAVTDRAIVEANAEVIACIRLAHRKDIARSRRLAMAMLDELEQVTENRELFEELGKRTACTGRCSRSRWARHPSVSPGSISQWPYISFQSDFETVGCPISDEPFAMPPTSVAPFCDDTLASAAWTFAG